MNDYFKRVPNKKIEEITQRIAEQTLIILDAKNTIAVLTEGDKEFFYEKEIISEKEYENKNGLYYEMGISLHSMNIKVEVYPNSHNDSYCIILNEWGRNSISPVWYSDNYPHLRCDFDSYEDAKETVLGWLKNLIDVDELKTGRGGDNDGKIF